MNKITITIYAMLIFVMKATCQDFAISENDKQIIEMLSENINIYHEFQDLILEDYNKGLQQSGKEGNVQANEFNNLKYKNFIKENLDRYNKDNINPSKFKEIRQPKYLTYKHESSNPIFDIIFPTIDKKQLLGITKDEQIIEYDIDKDNCLIIKKSLNFTIKPCIINQYLIPVPNFKNVFEVFCSDKEGLMNSNNRFFEENKRTCETQNRNSYITEIEKYFKELQVTVFEQRYKIKENYYTIKNTKSNITCPTEANCLIKPKKKNSSLHNENLYHKDNIKLDPQFKHFLYHNNLLDFQKKDNNPYTQKTKYNNYEVYEYVNKPLLMNDQLNEYYKVVTQWKCYTKINNNKPLVSLEAIYNVSDDVSYLKPVYDIYCHSDNSRSSYVTISIINGRIINRPKSVKFELFKSYLKKNQIKNTQEKEISQYNKIKINSEIITASNINTLDKSEKYTYNHVKRLQKLLPKFKSMQNLEPSLNVNLFINNEIQCKEQEKYAYHITNTKDICFNKLHYNNKGRYSSLDRTIIAHEYSHIFIDEILNTLENSYSPSFYEMFHGLADAISIAYNNNNCIAISKTENGKCKKYKKESGKSPRIISQKSSFINNISEHNIKNGDYFRGRITARMFQIAHEISKKTSNNEIIGTVKHWIRLIRSIAIYNHSEIQCYACDEDFFLAQQGLMYAYLDQIYNSEDEKFLSQYFYKWEKEGYSTKDPSCFDTSNIITGNCIINFLSIKNEENSFGLAESNVKSINQNMVILDIKTGINFKMESNKKISYTTGMCNDKVRIEFYNSKKDLNFSMISKEQKIPFAICSNIKNINSKNIKCSFTKLDFCELKVEVKPSSLIKLMGRHNKSLNNIFYLLKTCKEGVCENLDGNKISINVHSNSQILPKLIN